MIDYDTNQANWDDYRIREAFIYDGGESDYYNPIDGYRENRRIMGSIFDTWLRSVKADAWDEGFDSGYDQVLVERAATSRIDLRKNPYRSGEGVDRE